MQRSPTVDRDLCGLKLRVFIGYAQAGQLLHVGRGRRATVPTLGAWNSAGTGIAEGRSVARIAADGLVLRLRIRRLPASG
ncbi:MAG: hypothetical protein OXC19_14690 [Bryobacterales bacterium]|nr:hypothetical protein [Bryobacterales bacterium]